LDLVHHDNTNAGNNVKLKIKAVNSVIEISIPSAAVPPKDEAANMPKPKNKIKAI